MILNRDRDSPEDDPENGKEGREPFSPVGSMEMYDHNHANQHYQYTGHY